MQKDPPADAADGSAKGASAAIDAPPRAQPEAPDAAVTELVDASRQQSPAAKEASREEPASTPEAAPPAEDDECEYYEFRAHEGEGGYPLAKDFEANVCFTFDFGFDKPTQALAFKPMLDNMKVIHHFMLYSWDRVDASKPTVDCEAVGADAVIVAGWAPGSGDWTLPEDVGMDTGRGRFVLEVHYTNYTDQPQLDRSGMRMCATRKLRPNTASVSWLGNHFFAIPPHTTDYPIAGRCTPQTNQTAHVIRSWPHMHMLGKRMSMVLQRADGSRETVFDKPFSFSDQKQYDTPLVVKPGDSLLTTCYYDNPTDRIVTIGLKSTDEMCHNFVLAYPAGAIFAPGEFANSCVAFP